MSMRWVKHKTFPVVQPLKGEKPRLIEYDTVEDHEHLLYEEQLRGKIYREMNKRYKALKEEFEDKHDLVGIFRDWCDTKVVWKRKKGD